MISNLLFVILGELLGKLLSLGLPSSNVSGFPFIICVLLGQIRLRRGRRSRADLKGLNMFIDGFHQ